MPPLLIRSAIAIAAATATTMLLVIPAPAGVATSPQVRISGGSKAQQALMHQILVGMSPALITKISLTPPPKNLGDWPRAPTYLNVTGGGGWKGEAEWEGWLFKGAFGDLSMKHHLPPMFRFTEFASPPAATKAGAIALGNTVRAAVSSSAGTSDVQVVSLQVLRPDGLAVALVLQTSDPASYMQNELPQLLTLVRGGKPELDGTYIVLEDSTGSVVWDAFQSTRVGSGSDYASPDLAGCNPIMNFGPAGYSPPACPA